MRRSPSRIAAAIRRLGVIVVVAALLLLIIDGNCEDASLINKYFNKSIIDVETTLTTDDFANIRQRRQINDNEDETAIDDSAMYNKGLFEGDIVTLIQPNKNDVDDAPIASVASHGLLMRNAVRQSYLKWPEARIPYTVSSQYTSFGRQRIASAIQEYSDRTCVKFVPKTSTDLDYVHIVPQSGCFSMVGKVGWWLVCNVRRLSQHLLGAKQVVSIGNGCLNKGIIIHELMHAVGFFHEQSRADRDDFIKILWNNVEPGLEDQFDKYSLDLIDHLGTKYDYGSVLHYGPTAFSKNGSPTIEPLNSGVKIGQRINFSANDVLKINMLYQCTGQLQNATGTTTTLTLGNALPITVTNVPANGSPPSTPTERCEDLRDDCALLALRGHCVSVFGAQFMAVSCRVTCGRCPTGSLAPSPLSPVPLISTATCQDSRPWCAEWATNRFCELFLFASYMRSRCPRSCNQC